LVVQGELAEDRLELDKGDFDTAPKLPRET
jgi:hypothetical protein